MTQPAYRAFFLTAAVIAGTYGPLCVPSAVIAAEDTIQTNAEGLRHGRVILHHDNGERHVLAAYRDGLLHGTYREFSPEGRLTLQAGFQNGQLHGRLERRSAAGDRVEIARYREGRREGTRQIFREGELVLTESYQDGECTGQEGDPAADPGPPTFAIGSDGLAQGERPPADPDAARGHHNAVDAEERPAHQRDTAHKPAGYPSSIDDITRAFERIDRLTIEGGPDARQASAIRHLIKYRLLSGVPEPIIAFDRQEAILAQRAAEICHAIGRVDHHPPNPGMANDAYRQAAEGAQRSCLWHNREEDERTAVEVWVIDFGANNRDEVGHRRACLRPGLYETAYGEHEGYASLLIHGNLREHAEYDVVACPGPGYQPVEFFDYIHRVTNENLIWSVHLNTRTYATPDTVADLRVTVSRVSPDGTSQEVRVNRVHLSEDTPRFPAILIEPEIALFEPGAIYEVNIQGLQRQRRPYTLTYRVEFFSLGE